MRSLSYRFYRPTMKLLHRYGWHYAPKMYPPEPSKDFGLLPGTKVHEWHHWCQWCGLRGRTIEIDTSKDGDALSAHDSNEEAA